MITEEHFNQEIDKLNKKLNAIYQMLKDSQTTKQPTTIVTQNVQSTDLVPKNTIDWDNLLRVVTVKSTKKIVMNIRDNKYPTLTKGQIKLLSDIGNNYNVKIL